MTGGKVAEESRGWLGKKGRARGGKTGDVLGAEAAAARVLSTRTGQAARREEKHDEGRDGQEDGWRATF